MTEPHGARAVAGDREPQVEVSAVSRWSEAPRAPEELPGRQRAREALREVAPEPGVAKPDPILVVDRAVRRFGGLTAVDVDHLEIQRGTITAVIGPNGAGKTTLFNLLTGFDRGGSGTWTFNGTPMQGMRAHQVARRGMVRTFQLTKALARLTVLDNMRLGATGQRGESFWRALVPGLWHRQEREITARADELLARFRLDRLRDDFAGTLSGGQRKLLEMARALMVGPDLVMLDEPMAGVNPALTQSLLDHVTQLREDGMTVVFIEHDMDMVHHISDWVAVMGEGRVIAEGTPDQVMVNQQVIDAYLGAHHDGTARDPARVTTGDPAGAAGPEQGAGQEHVAGREAAGGPDGSVDPDRPAKPAGGSEA